jgi:hypothetical protein
MVVVVAAVGVGVGDEVTLIGESKILSCFLSFHQLVYYHLLVISSHLRI